MECIPASAESLKDPTQVSVVRANSAPRRSLPERIPLAPRNSERLTWTCNSFKVEAMKQDQIKVLARNDALREVLKLTEGELKDCRQKLAETNAKIADQDNEIQNLKQQIDQQHLAPSSSAEISEAFLALLEVLPVQKAFIELRVKSVLDTLPLNENKRSAVLAKRQKRPSSLKRLFNFGKKKTN